MHSSNMATKRPDDEDDKNLFQKRAKTNNDDSLLSQFLEWSQLNEIILSSKVTVGKEGSCAQYGMIACEDIKEGECIFEIPRSILLTPETSGIANILCSETAIKDLESDSGWVPLLVALMYEYSSVNSKWGPYMRLVPNFDELDLPMFWDSASRESLHHTGIYEAIKRDEKNIENEFTNIVLPFMKKHEGVFSSQCYDLDFYKKMVAFVMSYSFTEPLNSDEDVDEDADEDKPPPMMVPMADILNHVAKNNAHLDFGEDSLKMVATQNISKGEEVFNTYGQLANWQLLHMYGFAEVYPNNHYDTVDIPMRIIYSSLKSGNDERDRILEAKWDFMKNIGLVSEDSSLVIGIEGVLTEEEMSHLLKIVFMSENEFAACKENDGWMDDDEDEEDQFSFENLHKLPTDHRKLIHKFTLAVIKKYNAKEIPQDESLPKEYFTLTNRREKYSFIVKHGQLKLLSNLCKACNIQGDY